MRRTKLIPLLFASSFLASTHLGRAQTNDAPLAPWAAPAPSTPPSTGSAEAAPPAPGTPVTPVASAPVTTPQASQVAPATPVSANAQSAPRAPSSADGEDAPRPKRARFGARGQVVLSAFSGAGIASTHYSESAASRFSVDVSPGLDVFFEKNISIGIDLWGDYSQNQGYGADSTLVQTTETTFGIGPRIGALLPLGDLLSWYPRLTMSVTSSTTHQEVIEGRSLSVASFGTPSSGTEHAVRLSVFAPLILQLAPRFFVGLGPRFARDLSRKNDALMYQNLATSFGAGVMIGGWL